MIRKDLRPIRWKMLPVSFWPWLRGRFRPAEAFCSQSDEIGCRDQSQQVFLFVQYTAEEVIGKNISLLMPTDRPEELPEIFERLKRGERIGDLETMRVRKDGTQIDVMVSISPLKDANGEVVGASAIARDISDYRRAEQLTEANGRILSSSGL